jgi:serine/threonine-protein kinase ATR
MHREHTEALFSGIFNLLETAKPPVKETVLIIVGSLGKYDPRLQSAVKFGNNVCFRSTNPDVLCKVVCCLISQLGKANPVLKGTAYMQVGLSVALSC